MIRDSQLLLTPPNLHAPFQFEISGFVAACRCLISYYEDATTDAADVNVLHRLPQLHQQGPP